MTIPIYQVDAFTAQRFAGNPAAVCILPGATDTHWQQAIAAEMNLSETAFIHPHADGFQLRWFTPQLEVDLCGHATLAAAHVLWQERGYALDQAICFYTRSGLLSVRRVDGEIEMDFPATPIASMTLPTDLEAALGCEVLEVMQAKPDCLIRLASEDDVRHLKPDFAKLRNIMARGFIVTAPSDDAQYDFVSRFFAPSVGIDEDPVTGSAHCALGPYWSALLNKTELSARQVSARGGTLKLTHNRDRILLRGQAITIFKGTLYD